MDLVDATPEAPPRLPAGWKAAFASTLLIPALAAAGLLVHTPYFAISPGPATDVSSFIRVDGNSQASEGAFLITTVSVTLDTINYFEWMRAGIDPAIQAVPREALVQPGFSDEQQDQINRADMEESKYVATVVAMRASRLPVTPLPGARVIAVFANTPAAAELEEGDVIVAVDGRRISGVPELIEGIGAHEVGERVRLEVLRGADRLTVSVPTIEDSANPGRPIVGFRPAAAFRLPAQVSIDSQDIVGPSAGLVFTLAIADALTPDDLTRGHRIAATGTIALDGSVGPIGGVSQKVRAASFAGADIFFVPAGNLDEARTVPTRMRVVGVATVSEAVGFLDDLAPGEAA